MTLLQRLLDRWLFCHFIGAASGVIGIAGGLNSLFGGDDGAPSSGSYIWSNPADQQRASEFWMDAMNKSYANTGDFSSMTLGPILAALQRGLGTQAPGTAQLPGQLAGAYGNMAGSDALFAQILSGAGANSLGALTGAGNQVWNTSLDPQNALHDQILQRVVDSSRAGQSARGIAMGGVGQGLEDEAIRQFETGWSNELLGRQVQGLTALERALATGSQVAGNNFAGASQFYGQIPGAMIGAASAPYTAEGINSQWLNSLISGLGGSYTGTQIAPYQQIQNQAIPYMYQGAGAGANAFQGNMLAYDANQANQAAGLEALLSGMQQFGNSSGGNWLNNMWSTGGQNNNYYGAQNMYAGPPQ